MSHSELWEAEAGDERAEATKRRNSLVQTFGNLTILSQPLNSSVSNNSWEVKKPEILLYSLLPINQQLYSADVWDEDAIESRSRALATRALTVWGKPRADEASVSSSAAKHLASVGKRLGRVMYALPATTCGKLTYRDNAVQELYRGLDGACRRCTYPRP
jgi:hypothetical protein